MTMSCASLSSAIRAISSTSSVLSLGVILPALLPVFGRARESETLFPA
jgi:hypothetical protein